MRYLSNCCSAPVWGEYDPFPYPKIRLGMCSKCKDMSTFTREGYVLTEGEMGLLDQIAMQKHFDKQGE